MHEAGLLQEPAGEEKAAGVCSGGTLRTQVGSAALWGRASYGRGAIGHRAVVIHSSQELNCYFALYVDVTGHM